MTETSEVYLAYVVSHEAWYAPHLMSPPESVQVQNASTGGGVKWEFCIERVRDIGIQVQIFDDAWDAFVEVPDLFRELQALGANTNLDEVREVLDRLGFKDITARKRDEVTA